MRSKGVGFIIGLSILLTPCWSAAIVDPKRTPHFPTVRPVSLREALQRNQERFETKASSASSSISSGEEKDEQKRTASRHPSPPLLSSLPASALLTLKASSDTLLMTTDGQAFYEYGMSGEGNNCALYCLEYQDRESALDLLLRAATDPEIRQLILPEILADLAEGEVNNGSLSFPSRFIAESPAYKALHDREEKAKIALNTEIQRLKQLQGLTLTPTEAELEKRFKPEDLETYDQLAAEKAQADTDLTDYLTTETVFKKFVTNNLRATRMITYLPGAAGTTSMICALARVAGYNLVIYGKNTENKLVVVYRYEWDRLKPTKTLLHTRYQDENGNPVLGGVPGTVRTAPWNHFNLLDTQKTIQRRSLPHSDATACTANLSEALQRQERLGTKVSTALRTTSSWELRDEQKRSSASSTTSSITSSTIHTFAVATASSISSPSPLLWHDSFAGEIDHFTRLLHRVTQAQPDRVTPILETVRNLLPTLPDDLRKKITNLFDIERHPPEKPYYQPQKLTIESHKHRFLHEPAPSPEHPFLSPLNERIQFGQICTFHYFF